MTGLEGVITSEPTVSGFTIKPNPNSLNILFWINIKSNDYARPISFGLAKAG